MNLIKELLLQAELETESQLKRHQKAEGECNSRCGSLNHYRGRMELIRWLRESMDKRRKSITPLNNLEW